MSKACQRLEDLQQVPDDLVYRKRAEQALAEVKRCWEQLAEEERQASRSLAVLIGTRLCGLLGQEQATDPAPEVGTAPAQADGGETRAFEDPGPDEEIPAEIYEQYTHQAPGFFEETQLSYVELSPEEEEDHIPTPEELLERFGYSAFREGQREAVQAALDGRDSLVIMPTGGGKSLCYQLPGLATSKLTIVVSPLIALMQDQHRRLVDGGAPAVMLASGMGEEWNRKALADIHQGRARLVLASPERFASASFRRAIQSREIALFAIDEAHCLSEWGHDFRPDYLRLRKVIEELGRPPVMACTATATPKVAEEIVAHLQLRDPVIVHGGFDRPNISWDVVPLAGKGAVERKARLLAAGLSDPQNLPAIVYCGTRKDVESVCERLCREGVRAVAYHAGFDADTRQRAQDAFMSGKAEVVVATNAFGMGVDKADVRSVWHWALPTSVEAYYQEAGRAGRDGKPARAVLLAMRADLGRLINFNRKREMQPETVELYVRDLAERAIDHKLVIDPPQDDKERVALAIAERCGALELEPETGGRLRVRLSGSFDRQAAHRYCRQAAERGWEAYRAMERFSSTHDICRRRQILDHFGDRSDPKPLGRCCDVCDPPEWLAALEQGTPKPTAQVKPSSYTAGQRGKKSKRKPAAADAQQPVRAAPSPPPAGDDALSRVSELDLLPLKEWRKRRAGSRPAYTVCKDQTLAQILLRRPLTRRQLAEIPGVGPAFMEKHADSLLSLLKRLQVSSQAPEA